MRGIGVEVSSAARDEVAAVSDALDEAGPFFAYSPSDISRTTTDTLARAGFVCSTSKAAAFATLF